MKKEIDFILQSHYNKTVDWKWEWENNKIPQKKKYGLLLKMWETIRKRQGYRPIALKQFV